MLHAVHIYLKGCHSAIVSCIFFKFGMCMTVFYFYSPKMLFLIVIKLFDSLANIEALQFFIAAILDLFLRIK